MTLNELIERLTDIRDGPGRGPREDRGDMRVGVAVTGCLSSHAQVEVRGVGPGIDWSRNWILLSPEEPLERYRTPKERQAMRERVKKLTEKKES